MITKAAKAALAGQPLTLSDEEREQSLAASRAVAELRQEGEAAGIVRHPRRVMTEERWARFIACVREIGDARHAAALADGDLAWTWLGVYQAAMRRDPLRAREFDGAVAHFHARLHRELLRRGIEGTDVAKWHEGGVVGYEKQYDSKIALALASHHLRLIERRQDVSVTTHNGDAAGDTLFSLTYESVMRMPVEMRRALVPILEWVRADRAKLAGEQVPAIEASVEGDADGAESRDPYDLAELAEIA